MTAGSEGSPVFDYSSLDFQGMEKDLITFIRARWGTETWTDFNESEETRRLIEMVSYATDLLSYTENAHAQETVISSLIREQNFRNIVKSFDFTLKSASPSRTTFLFTLDPDYLPIDIPANTKIGDDKTGQVIFQPDISGTATENTYFVTGTQGLGIEGEVLGNSTGNAGQRYTLDYREVIDGTLSVYVNGSRYLIIKNFIEAGPTEAVCLIETDEYAETTIKFGDGLNGRIPPLGQTITATYKVGGGNVNFPKNTITRLITAIPGVLSVTNVVAAEGGGPKQSLLMAKRLFPLTLKMNERCVTLQDYATAASQFVPGVLKARAVSGLFQAGGNPVLLYVVPNGGGEVPSSLANLIVSTLRYGRTDEEAGLSLAGRRVFVRTAVYVNLKLTVDAFVNKGSRADNVKESVIRAALTRYSLETNEFGDEMEMSLQDAYNTFDPEEQKISGLTKVFLRQFSVQPYSGKYITKPSTGNGMARAIRTSVNTQRREWHIQVAPSNKFYVYQRQLGTISRISEQGIEDEQAGYDEDSLVTTSTGYRLRVREQEQQETFNVVANKGGNITVSGASVPGKVSSLLVLATNRDSYAVERKEPVAGKILQTSVTGPYVDTYLPVTSSAGFVAGDYVMLISIDNEEFVTRVMSKDNTHLVLEKAPPFVTNIATTVHWYWWSEDKSVGFALVQGATPFVAGDELYVDTFSPHGDIKLRPENYPVLLPENLVVNPVGGVK